MPQPAAKRMEPSHSRWATQTGTPQQVEDAVEGPHGQQVADVLVADRAQPDGRVPHEGHLAQEAAGVEVEVGLGVGRDHAGPHHQQRDVGQQGQHAGPPIHHQRVPTPARASGSAALGAACRPRGAVTWGTEVMKGGQMVAR